MNINRIYQRLMARAFYLLHRRALEPYMRVIAEGVKDLKITVWHRVCEHGVTRWVREEREHANQAQDT